MSNSHVGSHPEPLRHGVVAVLVDDQQRWLVIRRSMHVRAPGKFCFPGGGIEPGEAPHEALVREMQEELSIDVEPRHQLFESVTSWGVHLAWWSAHALQPLSAITPNPDEVAECHWLKPSQIGNLEGLLESNLQFLAAYHAGEFQL